MDRIEAQQLGETENLERPSKMLGAVSGGLTALGFVLLHDLWISDIWFNIGPMLVAGALCGLVIVWSYTKAVPEHSWTRWLSYNAYQVGLLAALGAVSLVVLDPEFTMAEAMAMDDALAVLLPPALPLMIAAMLVGTILLWIAYGLRRAALVPILVTQVLLVFLVGHNLAILGLVELSGALVGAFVEFIALTAFLGFGFAVALIVLARVRARLGRPSANTRR